MASRSGARPARPSSICRLALLWRGKDPARAAEPADLGTLAVGRADADQDEIGIAVRPHEDADERFHADQAACRVAAVHLATHRDQATTVLDAFDPAELHRARILHPFQHTRDDGLLLKAVE